MSTILVKKAIRDAVADITPILPIAWENVEYTPTMGNPYQKVHVFFISPDNRGYGSGPYMEEGFFQISLYYPKQIGTELIDARADLIRATFKRGSHLISGTQDVVVNKTPTISSGKVDEDWYMIPVTVYFFSNTGV